MLNTLLFLAIGTAVTIILARMNKSNGLFWKLAIAMLVGFAGGTISNALGSNTNYASKHAGLNQSVPTQGSTIQFDQAYIAQIVEELDILAHTKSAKPVGKAHFVSTLSPVTTSSTKMTSRVREFVNLTNPGIAMNLFDTS